MRKMKRRLIARYIKTGEFPKYKRWMIEDGLTLELTEEGYEWRVGNYITTSKSVGEVWGMSPDQIRRFIDWFVIEEEGVWNEEGIEEQD